ncbi:MAG: hypothetical protein ACLFVO_09740 [Chloroflexaceae bacterium]
MDHEHHDMSEHRETANAAMYLVIPRLARDIAVGRTEDSRLFQKKIHVVNLFVKKIKQVPCCRRRVCRSSG